MSREPVEAVQCAHCLSEDATCIGAYEDMKHPEPACDDCCGHGCEDGHCDPITGVLTKRIADAAAALERAKGRIVELEDIARNGWVTTRVLAIAFSMKATEHKADQVLAGLTKSDR